MRDTNGKSALGAQLKKFECRDFEFALDQAGSFAKAKHVDIKRQS
jgi:hypothetical protein